MGTRRCRLPLLALPLLTAAILVSPRPAPAAQDVVTVETRPGITLRVALLAPDTPPKGVLVVFPGAEGAGSFGVREGAIRLGGNFLVRTAPKFVHRGFAVAIVDVPSDRARGMSDDFRMSPAHAQDIARLVGALAGRGLEPIYLVGTSRGTVSVAYLGTVLTDPRIKGLALTSSMRSIGPLPLSKISAPVLVVHHRDDACRATPYEAAARLPSLLSGSPRVTFVTVHGYIGVELPVVQVIVDWAAGNPVPSQVGL